ncbi:MAG: hypothetical protein KDB21_01870, partial [Acidimicrobiales bacterium]|nr:hypothetical protein [Acidimicrobiales bacterium]
MVQRGRRAVVLVVLALVGSLLVTLSPAAAENVPAPSDSSYVCVYEPNAQFPFIHLRSLPTAEAQALIGDTGYWPVNGHCLRLDPPNVAMCAPAEFGGELVWVDQPRVQAALDVGATFPVDGTCGRPDTTTVDVCVYGPDGNPQKHAMTPADADTAVAGGGYWPTEGKCVDRQPPKYPTCVGDQIVWVTDRPATPEL